MIKIKRVKMRWWGENAAFSVSESCWLLENSTRSRLWNSPWSILLKAFR